MKLFFAFALLFAATLHAQQTPNRVSTNAVTGIKIGDDTTAIIGFHGTAPVAQRSGANGTALTDSTGGDVTGATLASTAGITTLSIPITLASMTTSAADLVTAYTPGYKFKILAVHFATTTVSTGDAASQVLNVEIGTTNVTGGVVTATLAGTAVTAANTGTASDTISVEVAASGTVFTAGDGVLLIRIQNMDVQDNAAKTAELLNELRATLVAKGLHAGS